METLLINMPNNKSELVKQLLRELGVNFQYEAITEKKPSARDFLGLVSMDDAKLMEAAIEEGCGQINPDDWR